MDKKTASKTAPPPKHGGARLPLGNHPGNTGGKKGRSGRHPDAFKAFLVELKNKPKLRKAIEDAASDPEGRNFSSAWKTITDYDEARPASRTDVTSKGQQLQGVVILPATGDE